MSGHFILSLADKTKKSLEKLDEQCADVRYLRVSHDGFGGTGESLMQISHRHRHVYDLTTELARRGFMVYMAQDAVSRLVRDDAIQVIWEPVKNGLYKIYNNDVVYSLEIPTDIEVRHLFIIFSDVSDSGCTTSLSRYFSCSIKEFEQVLPRGAAVLVIADLGGVAGLLHFNSERRGSREKNIECLIRESIAASGVEASNVTMCGQRTGSAAAIYYASMIGAVYVVADPLIPSNDDERPWHNSCFVRDGNSILNKVRLAKQSASELVKSSISVLPRTPNDTGFLDWTNDGLSIRSIVRCRQGPRQISVRAAFIFVLALRAQRLTTAQLHGCRW